MNKLYSESNVEKDRRRSKILSYKALAYAIIDNDERSERLRRTLSRLVRREGESKDLAEKV